MSGAYGFLALAFFGLLPVMLAGHLLVGGMLSTFVTEWHIARQRPTFLPQLIFFGGVLALVAIPLSFAAASRQLRTAGPHGPDGRARQRRRRLWQVLPWASLLLWPALMFALSLVFDVMRWAADPLP